ncbi:hypothetical protein OG401_21930 [Kitasatospora purpeofusca]|uniref:hypothetical protein n=1 Tax=Kitasatospora purpeofusca TaxID=67352 RepID=UPI00224C8B0E|nr:hypothetical protein [Kitasatospora purpeofusca]MCX4686932.1 hypothetical protein [Kitasatospora purpeofusca]
MIIATTPPPPPPATAPAPARVPWPARLLACGVALGAGGLGGREQGGQGAVNVTNRNR